MHADSGAYVPSVTVAIYAEAPAQIADDLVACMIFARSPLFRRRAQRTQR